MSERYSRVFALPEGLYSDECKVIIQAGAILIDGYEQSAVAQLKLVSVSKKPIKAVRVKFCLKDIANRIVDDSFLYTYLDLNVRLNEVFGSKTAISLPNNDIRSFDVIIDEIVFDTNEVWKNGNTEWKKIDVPKYISTLCDSDLLYKQYIKFNGDDCVYIPQNYNMFWSCVCGSLNSSDSICCEKCHRGKNYFSGIDNEALRNRLEDETKKQEFDTKAKKKNKTIMIGIAGIVILIAIIAGILIYPKTVVSKIKTGMAGRVYKSAEDIPGEEEFYFECKEDGTLIRRYRFYMPVLNGFCDWVEQKGSYEIINDGFNYYMNIAGMDMCNGYTGLYEFDSNGTPLYFIYGGNKYVLYK